MDLNWKSILSLSHTFSLTSIMLLLLFYSFSVFEKVDPTGQYLALFNLYDPEGTGLIDFKAVNDAKTEPPV